MKEMKPIEPVEIIKLPKWAAGSHRALMKQTLFIPDFPLCQFPRQSTSPFSKELDDWHFVYMTNRTQGRYTYLFEKEPEPKEVRKFPIQMGYSSLWVLKKTKFFGGAGKETLLFRDGIAKPAEEQRIAQGDFVVLQDPLMKTSSGDVVLAGTEAESMAFARQGVGEFRCSLLVAQLIHNENWH